MNQLISEIDTSAQRVNIRMTEGDPVNAQWLVPGAASWAGTYVTKVLVGDVEINLACTVTVVNTTDALFVIQDEAQEDLIPTTSGYRWDIQQDDGPTRFGGLWFVDAEA